MNYLLIIPIIIAITYFLVILLIISGLIFRKKKAVSKVTVKPVTLKVTVIIPARNEESNIEKLLNDLYMQNYPKELTEFVIIDDASEDQTGLKVEHFASVNPDMQLKCIHTTGSPSKKSAIEKAIKISGGTLIITSDADCFHPVTWISSMVSAFENSGKPMVTGPVVFSGNNSLFSVIQELEFIGLMGATAGSAIAGFPLMCNGANLAFDKRVFVEVSGFSGNKNFASGDDQFLMMKIIKRFGKDAVKFNFSRNAVVETLPALTINEFYHQRLRWVSKNRGYPDKKILFVAIITYLINLYLLVGFFIPGFFLITALIFLIKLILDFIPVAIMSAFFKKKKLLFLYPLAFVFNILYVVMIGVLGMIRPFNWKGKRLKY